MDGNSFFYGVIFGILCMSVISIALAIHSNEEGKGIEEEIFQKDFEDYIENEKGE